MRRLLLAAGSVLALLPSISRAAGTTAAEFLRFSVGIPAGMSEAGGAIVGDATALYWNPAGLALPETADVYVSHNSLPMTLRSDYGAVSIPVRHGDDLPVTIGYSVQALTQSPIDQLDNTGAATGSYSATDMAHTLGLATQIAGFRCGVSGRYIRQSIASTAGSAIAGNAGVQRDFGDLWSSGISVSNLGSSLKIGSTAFPLPRTERAGVGLRLFHEDLLVAGDVTHVLGVGVMGHMGVQMHLYPPSGSESKLFDKGGVAVRGGYTFGRNRDDAYSGTAWGLSIGLRGIRADFSYQPYGELGTSLLFGLGYRFS